MSNFISFLSSLLFKTKEAKVNLPADKRLSFVSNTCISSNALNSKDQKFNNVIVTDCSTNSSDELPTLLSTYNVANQTNVALANIILNADPKTPALIICDEDRNIFSTSRIKLLAATKQALIKFFEDPTNNSKSSNEKNIITTIILAIQAGKTLSSQFINGNWTTLTPYPQYAGRGVLYSLPSFICEYTAEEKQIIRRAVIYCSPNLRDELPQDTSKIELQFIKTTEFVYHIGG